MNTYLSIVNNMDFNTLLHEKAEFINHTLEQLLASQQIDSELKEALKYTLGTPGKRLRSVLVLWCCELTSGQVNHNAEIAAAAIEMVHTYSFVHDDLPAMDDDDLRRGLPTCHKAFDEATAILAGDALLTLAFEILAKEIDEPVMAIVGHANLNDITARVPKGCVGCSYVLDCSYSASWPRNHIFPCFLGIPI